MKYNLVCIAEDGEYITDVKGVDLEVAQQASEDMGSRWIFYPYHVITTESGKTIKQCDWASQYEGMRFEHLIDDIKAHHELALAEEA